jgi:hypothetical protein
MEIARFAVRTLADGVLRDLRPREEPAWVAN